MHALFAERVESDARSERLAWVTREASGRYEMGDDRPTVTAALARLDEQLLSADEPDVPKLDPDQLALRRALGVA